MEAIIFCGVQASGKTTFFKEHFFKTHVRLSQDLLRTRNRLNNFFELCLKTQQPFVLENTNPTVEERLIYILKAKEKKYKIIGYYFETELQAALNRNSERKGKENIPEVGVRGTFNKLEIPTYSEGYDELYKVKIEGNAFVINKLENEI